MADRKSYLCPVCGLVAEDEKGAPICRHNIGAKPGPRPARMKPTPPWHPSKTRRKHK